jgi:response regulator RpfG family c-di-GMP phosphodiesterase
LPGKTNTERIFDLNAKVEGLSTAFDERFVLTRANDERVQAHLQRLDDEVRRLSELVAVLRRDADDLRKAADTRDVRRWAVVVAVVTSVAALAAQVVMYFLKK